MANRFVSFLLLQIPLFILFFEPSNALHNVMDYGADAGGKANSTRAFIQAWSSACDSSNDTTIYVPQGTFLLSPIKFNGPCNNKGIVFQIDGAIVASGNYSRLVYAKNWIEFINVDGLTIRGGSFVGRGEALWKCKSKYNNCPNGTPTLMIAKSKNILITGVASLNSALTHIVLVGCEHVKIVGVSISAPGDSPNTDGIHIHMSTNITITSATIRTGDDCISIGPGSSGLWMERIICGPGHGISIGSLGKGEGLEEAGVENVTVKTAVISDTQNGLRIKTWGTHKKGHVSKVKFEHVVMRNVQNPIVIDQNYCPHNINCPGQNSGIKISQVEFKDIKGSSATEVAVNFDCSPSNPCSGITLQDIALSYLKGKQPQSSCKHALGSTFGAITPPSCL